VLVSNIHAYYSIAAKRLDKSLPGICKPIPGLIINMDIDESFTLDCAKRIKGNNKTATINRISKHKMGENK